MTQSRFADWSIDIETLGTKYNAPILSIGAVQFDITTGETGVTFYEEIDLKSALANGQVDADTLMWWFEQVKKDNQTLFDKGGEKLVLVEALHQLSTLIRSKGVGTACRAWGNGATFDIGILDYAYVNVGHGLTAPWYFTNIRDMRTIVDVANIDVFKFPHVGKLHNALDDAMFQAMMISVAHRKIKRALGEPLPKWKGLPGYEPVEKLKSVVETINHKILTAGITDKTNNPPKQQAIADDDDEL